MILLRVGLTLKKIIGKNKLTARSNKLNQVKDKNLIDSYDKLDAASGIRKATLIDIALAKSNASSTTIAAILEALNLKMADYGLVYDAIKDEEILDYKLKIEKDRKNRIKKKNNLPLKSKKKGK